ncbi:CapA family protein [Candidatus Parcubacteria bacterium]|nr:MAG: CapA family protein [Candidatus Parcubacteria bacterium]
MRLLFVGDVMLGRVVNDILKARSPGYPWGDTLPIFKTADWRACNLECVVSDKGAPWEITKKAFHFRSDPENIEVLKAAGINAVSLANNHAFDYGEEALKETIAILDKNGICRAGAGKNLSKAKEMAISEIAELKIGFLALTDNEPEWAAEENKPGIFYVPIVEGGIEARKFFREIRILKKSCDILVVSCHWGPNWGHLPERCHIPFAKCCIDAGADIIFGHSPHVFRGIEIYKKKPIIYSAGDFINDYAVDEIERNDQSFIFIVETGHNAEIKRILLYPVKIADFQAKLAKGQEAEEIVSKMELLCRAFDTSIKWNDKEGMLEIAVS